VAEDISLHNGLPRVIESYVEMYAKSSTPPAPPLASLFPGNQSRLASAATIIIPPEEVRAKFKRVKPLKEISIKQRGWTLDVLNIVRRLVDSEGRATRVPNISGKSGTRVTRPSGIFTTGDPAMRDLHP
jgi:hypothetical protein